MMHEKTVLLDIDGVFIDNHLFEQKVTECIVQHLTHARAINVDAASQLWNAELAQTNTSPHWHDYDFHCLRLGLPPLARYAHEQCLSYLTPVAFSSNTWAYLASSGYTRIFVTDACAWVAKLKLTSGDFSGYTRLFSATDINLTKKQCPFWQIVFGRLNSTDNILLIDNSCASINAALTVDKSVRAIHFNFTEHITKLHARYAPINYNQKLKIAHTHVAYSHKELISLLKSM